MAIDKGYEALVRSEFNQEEDLLIVVKKGGAISFWVPDNYVKDGLSPKQEGIRDVVLAKLIEWQPSGEQNGLV
jgi:hypothetical protein